MISVPLIDGSSIEVGQYQLLRLEIFTDGSFRAELVDWSGTKEQGDIVLGKWYSRGSLGLLQLEEIGRLLRPENKEDGAGVGGQP